MRAQLVLVETVLWLGAVLNMALVVGYVMRLNVSSKVTRQLVFVASTGTAEYASLALLGLGVPIPGWWFAAGFGIADLVAARWLFLLYWAQKGRYERERPSIMSKSAKAIVAGLSTFASMFYAFMADDVITQAEWLRLGAAVIVTSGITWLVPNAVDAVALIRGLNPGGLAQVADYITATRQLTPKLPKVPLGPATED